VKTELQDGWIDYIADFLTASESQLLFDRLSTETPWLQGEIKIFGKKIATPRLEAFYADPGINYAYSGQQLPVHTFTHELKEIKTRIEKLTSEQFNCVLINLYRNGTDSNGWHADNEKELGINPLIASLSLGIERRFDLRHNSTKEKIELILKPGSLLIMGGELQHHWKHQIAKSKKIIQPRINLTFRKINGV
jgi:alkylated DNA repair dioxygenase AlkB